MSLLFLPTLTMLREPLAVVVREGERGLPAQFGACRVAELRREQRLPVVVESHEGAVEGGIPKGGENEAVVDVKALGVAVAIGPGNDVRGAQEPRGP